jgi:hypothetical protein
MRLCWRPGVTQRPGIIPITLLAHLLDPELVLCGREISAIDNFTIVII